MNFGTRVFIVASVVVLALIGLTFVIKPAAFEPKPQPPIEPIAVAPFVGVAPRKPKASTAAPAAGTTSPAPVVEEEAEERPDAPACEACRERLCTNYKGSGVNLVDGCFASVDPSQGADPEDPTFLSDCQAVVACAHEHRCALTNDGAASCYCGSTTIDDCIENGPAADSPCIEEWRRAARSSQHSEITVRFSDLKYPAGWANFLIECDFQDCKDKCAT